jgi:hypothetical protein
MSSSDNNLVAAEGVDEGSAASTVEGPGHPAVGSPLADVAGGSPAEAPSEPDDMESAESRAARDALGTGQQLQVGEG